MDVTSVPASIFTASPVQPSQAEYPFDPNLILFTEFTGRADFVTRTGLQPPPGDPTQGSKSWLDPAQAGKPGNVTYDFWDPNTGKYTPFTLSCTAAASVNLAGSPVYPVYVPPANSTQTIASLGTSKFSLSGLVLCTPANAALIASAIGSGAAVVPYPLNAGQEVADVTDFLGIQIGGTIYNAGRLATAMFSQGVGAPGSWSLAGGIGPVWTPGNINGAVVLNLAPIPTPQRPAQANETPQQLNIAGITSWVMARTDLAAPPANNDSAALAQINTKLDNLTNILTALVELEGTR